MSGEGACLSAIPGTDADCGIRAAARQGAKAQRGNALDATIRDNPGLLSKEKPFALSGEKTCAGWRGRLILADFQAMVTAGPLLTSAQLRDLASACQRMADQFDERVDW